MKGITEMKNEKLVEQGRIISVRRNLYYVKINEKEYSAKLAGKMRKAEMIPVVGDYVKVSIDEYESASILEVLPRKSFFVRPDRKGHADGYVKTMKEQPVIANYDYVFIITSLNYNFNVNRIARYAAITKSGGGIPVVILTKADLVEHAEEYIEKVRTINQELNIMAVSSYTGQGLDQIKKYFVQGSTIALLGSSGAGKSTLINTLAGREIMEVSEIRTGDSKGRHTTTHRQMIEVDGVSFIDTPGMRELGMCDVEEAIDSTFDDIAELICNCKFSNCHHDSEPGCAIKKALESGELLENRWKMYCNLQKESNWAKGHLKRVAKR